MWAKFGGRARPRAASAGDRAYVVIGVGTAAAALAAPRAVRHLSRWIPPALAETMVLGGMIAMSEAAMAALEARTPYREEWRADDGWIGADLRSLLVVTPIEGLVSHAAAAAMARRIRRRFVSSSPTWAIDAQLPLAVRLVGALAVSDLGHYWHHRLSHRSERLWRFHATHHRAQRMSWLNATRFHVLDMVPLMIVQDLMLLVLGMDGDTRLAHRMVKGIHGQVQHANLDGRSHALGLVLSTTEQHRLHHATSAPAGSHNFGAVLSIWDRAFGTFADPRERTPVTTVGLPSGRNAARVEGNTPIGPRPSVESQPAVPAGWR